MRNLHLLAAILSFVAAGAARAQTPAELAQLRKDRLAMPVFQQNGWRLDFEQAKAASKQSGKPVFAYFMRSYARCVPCETLEANVLATPAFATFSKQIEPFLHCASHTPDEPLPRLAVDRGFTSFPTICFYDADGSLLAHVGETKTLVVLEQTLAQVQQLQALRLRAAKGDAAADKQAFLLQLQLDALSLDEMQQRRQGIQGLTAEEAVQVDARITDAQLDDVLQHARELGPQEVGKRLAELARGGHRPSAAMASLFWNPVLTHARDTRDAALAKTAYDALVAEFGKDRRYERAMQTWRRQLEEAGGK